MSTILKLMSVSILLFLICCNGKVISTNVVSDGTSKRHILEPGAEDSTSSDFVAPGWQVKTTVVSQNTLIDVIFVNALRGWVGSVKGNVFQHYRYDVKPGELFRTTDGGLTWNIARFESPINSFITKVLFIDEYRGWILLQREQNDVEKIKAQFWVFVTTDGGESWVQDFTLTGARASKLSMKSNGEGWIVGAKVGAHDLGQYKDGVVLQTSDFGRSWQDAYPKVIRDENGKIESSLRSPIEGILETEAGLKLAMSNNGGIYQISTDNREWKRKLTVQMLNPDRSFGNGFGRFISLDNNRLITLRGSNFRGSMWSKLTLIQGSQILSENEVNDIYLLDLVSLGRNGMVACGYTQSFLEIDKSNYSIRQNGIVLFSADGKNWERIYEKSGVLQYTENGGETWETKLGEDVRSGFFAFTKITTDDIGRLFVVGSNGSFVTITTSQQF